MASNDKTIGSATKTSPLETKLIFNKGPTDAEITLKENKHVGKMILRGSLSEKKFITSTKKHLSQQFPASPNSFYDDTKVRVIWLGPDEWLILTDVTELDSLKDDLTRALIKSHSALVDVSDNSTIIEIKGRYSRAVLMKGCSLDIHPSVFQTGCSAQTDLGLANIILLKTADDPVYQIIVRASFASYLWDWLVDAAHEFKIRTEN
tara:strand:+ start:751 stop:1368 length:618 start_codon:yes stop_codon:yes gene_type:complete